LNLLGSALALYAAQLNRGLRRCAARPGDSQRRVLQNLLSNASNTAFGREHHFAHIQTHDQFAQAVPIGDYVARMDWVRRMLAGEPDVCWPGRVEFFAQTSGTTAGDKNIPVTNAMQRANTRAALSIFAYYSRRGAGLVRQLMKGQLLFLGGSTALTPTEGGGRIGDLSGIATRSIRWPLAQHYEPGLDLALIEDWEEKIEKVARRVIDRDVRFVTGMPSWVKILFDRLCALSGVDRDGGMSDIWPNLSLFVHGGVNFAPYRSSFDRYFRDDHPLEYLEVYPASEGFIAIQAEGGEPGMEMLVDNGLFYEFVPLSEWGKDDAPRLTIDQVETGVPYSLVLSTNAGLWAYDIGDVVEFVSLRPPRIIFAGRNKHFINAFGENIIGQQVSSAVASAADAADARVAEFTAAPRYADADHRAGAHEYVVEFERDPTAGLDAFAGEIDRHLQEVNHDYSVKRRGDLGMTSVEVSPVPKGTFYAWMKNRGKLGGQHKVPLCANDRRYVDELLQTAQETEGSA
jgi:GH3 auxin-responsive promoter